MKYAARRLSIASCCWPAVSVLSFLFADLAPGDFFSEMRLDPASPPETAEALRARHGLDRPLPVRYAAWLASMARGEFGYSLAYNSAVGPLLRQRIPGTLLLTATATLLAWLMAIPAGHLERREPRHVERFHPESSAFDSAIHSRPFIGGDTSGTGRRNQLAAGRRNARTRGRILACGGPNPRHLAPHGDSRGRARAGDAAGAGSSRTLGRGGRHGFALRAGRPRPRHPAPPPAVSPSSARRPQSPGQPVRLLARYLAERFAAGGSPGGLAGPRAHSSWKRSWRAILPWCWAW